MTAIYTGNGWDIYDGITLIGFMPEGGVEDPAAFDPNTYPWEDSPDFVASPEFDGNENAVRVSGTTETSDGAPIVVVRLVGSPGKGYLAAVIGDDGGFGSVACPSSYNRPCLTWFGTGERYATAEEALRAVAD